MIVGDGLRVGLLGIVMLPLMATAQRVDDNAVTAADDAAHGVARHVERGVWYESRGQHRDAVGVDVFLVEGGGAQGWRRRGDGGECEGRSRASGDRSARDLGVNGER